MSTSIKSSFRYHGTGQWRYITILCGPKCQTAQKSDNIQFCSYARLMYQERLRFARLFYQSYIKHV